jgi:hypothetical protein
MTALTGVARFRIPVSSREYRRRQGLKGVGMERADWLEEKVNAADARFLMVTAITHHRFSSPIWGAREVRKLHAELAEIAKHASEVLKEHQAGGKKKRKQKKPRPTPKYRGVFGAPAW